MGKLVQWMQHPERCSYAWLSTTTSLWRVQLCSFLCYSGACECGMACATCHVILDKKHYDALPEPTEEEEDCLDNASGLTETYVLLQL